MRRITLGITRLAVAASVGMATLSIAVSRRVRVMCPCATGSSQALHGYGLEDSEGDHPRHARLRRHVLRPPSQCGEGSDHRLDQVRPAGQSAELVEQVLVPKGSLNAAYTKVTQALGKCPPTETIGDGTTATFSSLSLPSIGTNTAYQSNITSTM